MTSIIEQAHAARALGLLRFMPTTPCKRGHLAERYVKGCGCTACLAFLKSPANVETRAQRREAKAARNAERDEAWQKADAERRAIELQEIANIDARDRAFVLNRKTYLPVTPCKRGHLAERDARTDRCSECTRESKLRRDLGDLY